MENFELTASQTQSILDYLSVKLSKPSVRFLNQLINAHVRRIPWESVTRILKRRGTPVTANCPRLPAEFWEDAMTTGSGGTCFENNYAFYSLLTSLGFQGYLTLNDMGETRGCHGAIVILAAGRKYLVDVSLPFDRAIPFHAYATTRRRTPLQTEIVQPLGGHRYRVTRAHHIRPDIFTLVDVPVSPIEFVERIKRDYEAGGFFLDKVVMVKAVAGNIWCFNSADTPYQLQTKGRNKSQVAPLGTIRLAQTLGTHFNMASAPIAAALSIVNPQAQPIPRLENAAVNAYWAFAVRRRWF